MASAPTFKLNTDATIPGFGLGTWQSGVNEVKNAVEAALRAGYRHIDTAAAYGNEHEVGAGIAASGVPRADIFLTTKLDNHRHADVAAALDGSLAALGVDYLDLYLVHWPVSTKPGTNHKEVLPDWDFVKTWEAMQALLPSGKVRAIGVSNFQIYHLEKLLADPRTKTVPAVNQIELHPYNPSPKLVQYCKEKGIHVTGYSPLGSTASPLQSEDVVKGVAEKYGKTVSQVLLNWGLRKGWSVIPKTVTESRVKENMGCLGWELEDEDVQKISALTRRYKVCNNWLPETVFVGDDE